jgi:hypothetical protein
MNHFLAVKETPAVLVRGLHSLRVDEPLLTIRASGVFKLSLEVIS